MEKTSLLQGTKWCWREGRKKVPMENNAGACWRVETEELYTGIPGNNTKRAQAMVREMAAAGIKVDTKITRSSVDKGQLIVFGSLSSYLQEEGEEENMKNLKNYILSHGGKIITSEEEEEEEDESVLTVLARWLKNKRVK